MFVILVDDFFVEINRECIDFDVVLVCNCEMFQFMKKYDNGQNKKKWDDVFD